MNYVDYVELVEIGGNEWTRRNKADMQIYLSISSQVGLICHMCLVFTVL